MHDQLDMTAIARIVPEVTKIRHDIHMHPELAYEEHRTAGIIAAALRDLGLEVTEGVGTTGVVGTLRRGMSPRSIGLRADMDALGFEEKTGLA
jgi:metal-dependent amidase/aminoacylase/carboxypeptidase family protein